ncbi:hypothetical protein DQ04_03091070 [Trypanosoma grayi]|uniref:hypothetical protein n=1 Tax=Trypanosoma grayi TaxID=71804 RepID=UPI0004F4B32F|nr:hypothetical protein DQ04_03091070 [Trypanosoma grayi]KEG10981.1 hypothetical protein DQ04_03091070 [Trypanosoma grayi]
MAQVLVLSDSSSTASTKSSTEQPSDYHEATKPECVTDAAGRLGVTRGERLRVAVRCGTLFVIIWRYQGATTCKKWVGPSAAEVCFCFCVCLYHARRVTVRP